ncbi:hypothetical protein GCM10009815_35020 [Nocardioides marmoribigeumensis]
MAYIDAHRHDVVEGREVGVEPICAVLKDAGMQIAPSSYYAAKTRPPSARAVRDAELVTDIKVAHKANLGVYGARKIHAELNREGVKVARCTVERLMRAEGLRGIPREKTCKTTIGDGAETERPEDLVKRKFIATAPNQLWVADLTYVRTRRVDLRRVRARRLLQDDRRLAGVDQPAHRPGARRPRHGALGPATDRAGPHRPDPPQRQRRAVSSDPLHRATGRSRRRRLGRQPRRFV